jgi:hypothetical protein
VRSEADQAALQQILREVKDLAVRYYKLTQKPLGVMGEIAEYEAHQKLGLRLVEARNPRFRCSWGNWWEEGKVPNKGPSRFFVT